MPYTSTTTITPVLMTKLRERQGRTIANDQGVEESQRISNYERSQETVRHRRVRYKRKGSAEVGKDREAGDR